MAFVHGVAPGDADPWFRSAGLDDVARVSDPSLAHYRAFALETTGWAALASPTLWVRGGACALRYGFGIQPPKLIRQLAGTFVVCGTRILSEFRNASPADRPDYIGLIQRAGSVTIR